MIALSNLRLQRAATAEAEARPKGRYFFGPITDFLLMGGLSLLIMPVAFLIPEHLRPQVLTATAIVAFVINHPHFAHSYQLFYRGFGDKAFGADYKRSLRLRYIFAGMIVPFVLAAFLSGAIAIGNTRILGVAANLMVLTVGWHYVKQGYGMLIVNGVLQRQFFNEKEKRVLLANAYAIWVLTWTLTNSGAQHDLWGIEYYMLDLPAFVSPIAIGVTVLTSVWTGVFFIGRIASSKGLPLNGVVAYLAALYLWLIFVRLDPIWALIVPALHSLQYLVVVWRYELNRNLVREDGLALPKSRLSRRLFGRMQLVNFAWFLAAGVVLGTLGFWIVPITLQVVIPLSFAPETSAFLFACWIFINVHHYFIDNVIWRSENPDIKRYLMDSPRSDSGRVPEAIRVVA